MTDAKLLRKELMRLMREDFDPTPPNWEGRDWDDNAEGVADKMLALLTPSVSPSAEARGHAENLRETAGFMRNDGLPHAAQELDDAATFIERTPSHPLQGAVTEEKIKEAALRAARRHSGNATRNDVYEEGFVAGANFITAALQSPAKEGKE
jgi:hypothetical protein